MYTEFFANNNAFLALVKQVKDKNIELCTDSRSVAKNSIFISMPILSNHEDKIGKQIKFLYHASQRSPLALIASDSIAKEFTTRFPEFSSLVVPVENERKALGALAIARYNTANLPFPILGITGTNGKTTLSYLLEYFFESQEKKVGVLGTVSYRYPNFSMDAPLTTPDCLKLHSFYKKMQEAQCFAAIMEVSSHAIEQDRIAGLAFESAIFTNLTQDHLDYHKTMEEYFDAKSGLFERAKNQIINADDAYGLRLLDKYPSAFAYTLDNYTGAHKTVFGKILKSSPKGLELELKYKDEACILNTPLIGQHNAANVLAVATTIVSMGFSLDSLACLSTFNGVSGRLERVVNAKDIHAFVDYAHTPDALINVLQALRTAGFTNIVTVFGCGGDRDKSKRPLMAEAVSKNSDVSIITSDNPRTENPTKILKAVEAGIDKNKEYYSIEDRKEAILFACDYIQKLENKDNTVLLIAGKGHETYQIIGTTKYPFSDQEILRGI